MGDSQSTCNAMVARQIDVLSDDDAAAAPGPPAAAAKPAAKSAAAKSAATKSKPEKPLKSESEEEKAKTKKTKVDSDTEPREKAKAKKQKKVDRDTEPQEKAKAKKKTTKKTVDPDPTEQEAVTIQKKPAMKRPAAAGESSATREVRKATKYCYHKENKWGVKLNGKEQCTARCLVVFCFGVDIAFRFKVHAMWRSLLLHSQIKSHPLVPAEKQLEIAVTAACLAKGE